MRVMEDIDPNVIRWLIIAALIICGAGGSELGLIV